MRHVYSVVRFVPDPARGEFVNLGLIVGNDESGEWQIRHVENAERARRMDERRALPALWEFFDRLGRQIDELEEARSSLLTPMTQLSEGWLRHLATDQRNVVQLTPPSPIVADTVDEAMDALFEQLVLDPATRKFPFRKKHPAVAAVNEAYAHAGLKKDQDYFRKVLLVAVEHKEVFDFAVGDGVVRQLAHTWSFEIPDQEALAEGIKAWGWTARRMIDEGGRVVLASKREVAVPGNVDLVVVYVPPREDDTPAFREAVDITEKVSARFLPLERAEEVVSALR